MTLDDPQSPPQQHSHEAEVSLTNTQNLNFTEIENRSEKSHLSKTLTLDHQIAQHSLESDNSAAAVLHEQDPGLTESLPEPGSDMELTSPIRAGADSLVVGSTVAKATPSRRGQKRKRVNRKQLVAIQQKVQILMSNLKLFPFVRNRALDFAAHETLLKHLGLWDFVHVELDSSNLRVDLIAQLIANYKKHATGRVSEVNGVRIKVSRADLGRALKLPPVKKDGNAVVMMTSDEYAGVVSEKSIRFIEELMSNWMLLHDEDTWMMPEEVMNWIDIIRKGHPERVEWASLMWFMVEKELSQGVRLVDCYYASHLQHLIKHQNEKLFIAKPDEVVSVREEEDEEEGDGGDVEMVDEAGEHVASAVSEDHVDDKMVFTHTSEYEAVSKQGIDDKMSFTLSCEQEAASKEHIDDKLALTLTSEHEAVTMELIDDKMPFTLTNERKDVSQDCTDDKKAFTLSNEHEALSEDHKNDKKAFTLSNEYEAVTVDLMDDKMAHTLSNEFGTGSENHTGDKMAFMLNNGHEAEKMGIDVNQVCSDGKISEEYLFVKDGVANNETHMKDSSPHIEANKSNIPELNSEELNIELTLGQDNIEEGGIANDNTHSDNVLNYDDLGFEDTDNWQLDGRNGEGEPFLQPCGLVGDNDSFDVDERVEEGLIEEEEVDDEEDVDEEEEEDEVDEEEEMDVDDFANDEERINQSLKFDSLQGISSAHIFQGVDLSQGAFGSPLPYTNESHLQHFASPAETSSAAIGNALKRTANNDQNLSSSSLADENKRFRSDTWNHQEPSDFDRCMENIEHWMGKAKMMYAAKAQECNHMEMNQQLLYGEVEQQNHMFEHQQKITNEVRQKSQMEIYKLEHELFVMGGLLDYYRKALKETRREFSEYRQQCSIPEEPLYRDAGPGGVVLSVAEIEKQRIKQEEEDRIKRLELESTIKSFEIEWCRVFEVHHSNVQKLDDKLLLLEEHVKLLKSIPQRKKAVESPEHPANMKVEEIPEQSANMKTEEIPEQPMNMEAEEIPEQPVKTED